MATRLFFRTTRTAWYAGAVANEKLPQSQYDLLTVAGSSNSAHQTAVTAGGTKFQMTKTTAQGTNKIVWNSERFAAAWTLSGNVTISIGASEPSVAANAGFLVELYKVTSGGSNVETLIGAATSVELPVSTAATVTITLVPTVPIDLAEDERFVARLFFVPVGGTMGTFTLTAHINAASGVGFSYLEFTEAFTTKPNGTKLWLRRTNTIGIGTFFDAIQTQGVSAFTTGVVATAAVVEKQWTRTSGGTVLEWVTPRLIAPFYFDTPTTFYSAVSGVYWALESNALANAYAGLQLLRLRDGVETQMAWIVGQGATSELAITAQQYAFAPGNSGSVVTATALQPDDRIVIRAFIRGQTPATNMVAGHTCTINYDHSADGVNGESWVSFFDAFDMKAEGDAAFSTHVPDGQILGGVGN